MSISVGDSCLPSEARPTSGLWQNWLLLKKIAKKDISGLELTEQKMAQFLSHSTPTLSSQKLENQLLSENS